MTFLIVVFHKKTTSDCWPIFLEYFFYSNFHLLVAIADASIEVFDVLLDAAVGRFWRSIASVRLWIVSSRSSIFFLHFCISCSTRRLSCTRYCFSFFKLSACWSKSWFFCFSRWLFSLRQLVFFVQAFNLLIIVTIFLFQTLISLFETPDLLFVLSFKFVDLSLLLSQLWL